MIEITIMKRTFITLTGIIMLLIIVCGCLYKQNRTYRQENRRLIIENDSIMSVNIELSNKVKKHQDAHLPVYKVVYKARRGDDK